MKGAVLFCAAVLALPLPAALGEAVPVNLRVSDEAAGGTIRYLGGYGLAGAVGNPDAKKYVVESGANTTKFWLGYNQSACESRGEFYGPDFKDLAIRQVTKRPETVEWEIEINCRPDRLTKLEEQFKACRDNGIMPVLEVNNKLKGIELRRRFFWRYTFLLSYYLNGMKGYGFTLWNFGSEHGRLGPEQLEVGSDAIRASEKLTGVPVLVGGCGDDGDIDIDFETVLKSEYAERINALSFHGFNFRNDFPKLGIPGLASSNGSFSEPYDTVLLERFDGLQKKFRPDRKLLPYWDTGWYWRDSKTGLAESTHTYMRDESKTLIPYEYIGRCIHACKARAEVFIYCSFYGNRDSSAVRAYRGEVTVMPLYYAIRMMARANLAAAERLDVAGGPGDATLQALATRSGKRVYVTCLSRERERGIDLAVKMPKSLEGRPFVVRRLDSDHRDDIVERGAVAGPVVLKLSPISALQIEIERP